MFELSCAYCGKKLLARMELAGKKVKCPACGHKFFVPSKKIRQKEARPEGTISPESKQKMENFWERFSNEEIADMLVSESLGDPEEEKRKILKKLFAFFIPRYNDLTLFTLSLSFLLLLAINTQMRKELTEFITLRTDTISDYGDIGLFIMLLLAPVGLLLSLFNVFLKRDKYDFEKYLMLAFAVAVTGGTGIYAGYLMLKNTNIWLILFPLWNVINGAALLLLFRYGVIDNDCITDETANFIQIVLSIAAVMILISLCHYILQLHWVHTYSICACYAISFNNALQDILKKGGKTETA